MDNFRNVQLQYAFHLRRGGTSSGLKPNANEISFISLLKAESIKPKAFQFKQSQEVRL